MSVIRVRSLIASLKMMGLTPDQNLRGSSFLSLFNFSMNVSQFLALITLASSLSRRIVFRFVRCRLRRCTGS